MSLSRLCRLLATSTRHPDEVGARLRTRFELRQAKAQEQAALNTYLPDPNWLDALHRELDVAVCDQESAFDSVWDNLVNETHGLAVHSHDGDRAFARAIWCAIRHGKHQKLVETGVARGVSSRIALEAVGLGGHLWSVDLPLLSEDWAAVHAAAVPPPLQQQWSYVRGSTRRRLLHLLDDIGQIDLFLQDTVGTLPTAGF